MLRVAGVPGVSDDPAAICTGSNSGHQIMNIATLAGAARIVLIGYDAQRGKDRKPHFFGAHPDNTEAPYANMIHEMKHAAPIFKRMGVEVLNATPGSALRMFPMMSIEEVLCKLTA